MDTHHFIPSRPDGVACIAGRDIPSGYEVCGYPAGHPIHATTPAKARTGVSDRTAAARNALAKLHLEIHDAVIPHYDDRNRIRELLRIIEQAL
jgi:hypothetical protein